MNGRFQPGKSGNPGGRPRAAHNIQELSREHTMEALDVLVQIMLNEKAPPNARVAAANTLLDRAYGKAPTFSTSDTQSGMARNTWAAAPETAMPRTDSRSSNEK
jgi:hypothetical protein